MYKRQVPKGDGYDIAYMVTHYAEREDTAGFNLIFFLDEEDVTKSILENASESTADFLIVDENDNIIFSANGIWTGHLRGKNLEPNKPVSYTHLDVYKRQLLNQHL